MQKYSQEKWSQLDVSDTFEGLNNSFIKTRQAFLIDDTPKEGRGPVLDKIMKKIFVTVDEFEQNGGILEKGRIVYDEADEDATGVFECQHGPDEIICYFGHVVDQLNKQDAYVQISCTPCYK